MNRTLNLTAKPAARRQRGTSLVEALIGLAVVGVTLGAALPGFSDLRDRQRLQAVAAQVETDIFHARSLAVERNQVLRISYAASAAGACYVVHTGNAQQCSCSATEPVATCNGGAEALRQFQLPAATQLQLNANVSSMAFEPHRGTVTPAGTLRLRDRHDNGLNLVVNIMGRVRSCSPAPGAASC